jgi:ADP-heptose:LPS heptosyltransferase
MKTRPPIHLRGVLRWLGKKLKRNLRRRTVALPPLGQIDAGQPHLIKYRLPLRRLDTRLGPIRILVVKVDHIGDFFVALPALEALRQAWPEADITFVCAPNIVSLAEASGLFGSIVPFRFFPTYSEDTDQVGRVPASAIRDHVTGKFDLAIDLRHDPDTRALLDHVDARYRAGFAADDIISPLDVAVPDLERSRDPEFPSFAAGDRLSILIEAVIRAFKPTHSRSLANQKQSRSLLVPFDGAPFVILSLGAGSALRKWPEQNLIGLARFLAAKPGMRMVLLGGERERALGDAVREAVDPDQLIDLIETAPIAELPGLISGAALFIGYDTGITHLAGQLGVPTLCIYGGVSDFRVWGPVGDRVFALQAIVPCAPCHIPKFSDCKSNHACMRNITLEDVIAMIEEIRSTTIPTLW